MWEQQGTPRWEQWWVERRGYTRSREPTREDHIKFANFDLEQHGLPLIEVTDDRLFINAPDGDHVMIGVLIRQHGFAFL
jgi:hypothetical protein